MPPYTCHHCNFSSSERAYFPNSEHVCKNCVRDRPIAWKAMLYILARSNNAFPAELKVKPAKRGKASHPLQNLSNASTRCLADQISFDTVLFKEWTTKKLQLQEAKGGQCAYSDACLDHMVDWISAKKLSGHMIIHDTDIQQCKWDNILSPWPSASPASAVSETGGNHVVPQNTITPWELKARKAQRKNTILKKSHADLQEQYQQLVKRNKGLEVTNQTMRALIEHLTHQLIDANSMHEETA